MWEYLQLPAWIMVGIAALFCIVEILKACGVIKKAGKDIFERAVNKKMKAQNLAEELAKINNGIAAIHQKLEEQEERLDKIENRLSDLTVSDMHDIKGWITEQYFKFYEDLGYIDLQSAEVLEQRYADYKKEGGNSYIAQLMERMRTLPVINPLDRHEK